MRGTGTLLLGSYDVSMDADTGSLRASQGVRIAWWLTACGAPRRVSGVRGTGALLLAYYLHLDAFGGLHWDGGDLALGLALGAPIVGLGAPGVACGALGSRAVGLHTLDPK